MLAVAKVLPASGGFGMWADPTWSNQEGATVADYVNACRDAGSQAFADGDPGIPPDAQEAIREVDGRIYNQRGTLVAWRWSSFDEWSIYCVQVVES